MSLKEEMTGIPSPTKEKSNNILAIDKEAVHRICSGQVVLNLATAVKELVENSLDAGATSIEIRLREYGSELVEVVDNGCGVEKSNFEGLTLKHHTSKLREFSDLLGVETFGFRGEALSSLCALCELTVTTRHASSEMGSKLTYDSRGIIVSQNPCARQVGTTVALVNLFSPLPVRQKEFLRNLKREFAKMSQLLHAYCLISTGVKILCSNQTKKGGKSVVASTQGSSTYKGNIMSIFGAKQVASLLDFKMEKPSASHLEQIGLSSDIDGLREFELEGCISSCAHGLGRSSSDRQFYYINSRPCDPSKVSKVVNEVFHQFNIHQFPFVFLNIKTARDSVDVNVTPDKRQVFLDNEKLLLVTVKASLLKLYEKIPNSYQVQNVNIMPFKNISDINSQVSSQSGASCNVSASKKICNVSALLKNFSHLSKRDDTRQGQLATHTDRPPLETNRGVKRSSSSAHNDKDAKKQLRLNDFVCIKKRDADSNELQEHRDTPTAMDVEMVEETESLRISHESRLGPQDVREEGKCNYSDPSVLSEGTVRTSISSLSSEEDVSKRRYDHVEEFNHLSFSSERQENFVSGQNIPLKESFCKISHDDSSEFLKHPTSHLEDSVDLMPVIFDDEKKKSVFRKSVTFQVNMDKVKNLITKKREFATKIKSDFSCDGKPRIRFYAEIDSSKNKNAEQELNKEISKDMFSKMEIIGQFNLGFIITRLDNDLFIIDQHASDEKYNFETLQSQNIWENQKLVIPQTLDLTAVNECILMDNLDIFERNGFNFVIDQDAEPTRRVRLAARPVSHNWDFGKEDIDELLFMLQDSPHTMCRPSRVRAMFASRACRKSVMIGTALSMSIMRQIVNHMGEIEQPWNCPHGRPTMRHLVNLELIQKRSEKS